MPAADTYTTGEVFVPGGRPTVTYNARSELSLEQRVRDYLDDRHTILSVSGPTKTGKTVLLKSVVQDGIWLSGGAISTENDFWEAVADELQLFADYSRESSGEESQQDEISGGATIAIAHGDAKRSTTSTSGVSETVARVRSVESTVRQALSRVHTLVIDDFHYIPIPVQTQIVRGLKDLVFDGLAVVVAAVPHRAYDVVRVEKEMTGRVEQLPVGFWSSSDLRQIAAKGFTALNVADTSDALTARLIAECFESPHLMQDFLRALCRANGVESTQSPTLTLSPPSDWAVFSSRERQRPLGPRLTYLRKDPGSAAIENHEYLRLELQQTSTGPF